MIAIKKKYAVVFMSLIVVGISSFLHEDDYVADLGLGMTVSGDKYVDSGDWVFNCHNGDLIKKDDILFPDFDGNDLMNHLLAKSYDFSRNLSKKSVLNGFFQLSDWQGRLEYSTSKLSPYSIGISGNTWTTRFVNDNKEEYLIYVINDRLDKLNEINEWSLLVSDYSPEKIYQKDELINLAISSCDKEQILDN